MNVVLFWKNELRVNRGVLIGLSLLLTLAVALAVAASETRSMLRTASAAAAERFDLLVGAKASPTALLFGTVYLRDEALPIVPAETLKLFQDQKDVRWAAPVAFGDRAGEAPLVGTTRALVTFGGDLPVARGRVFSSRFEAVAGASSGFGIGDEVRPVHGRVQGTGHEHDTHFRVVGVAPPTGTPWDRAVLIPIEAVWAVHEHAGPKADHGHEKKEPLESWLEGDLSKLPGFSAVVVKPATIAGAYKLRQAANAAHAVDKARRPVNLMGVFTGEVLVNLYAVLGNASAALDVLTAAAVLIALAAAVITGGVLGRLRLPVFLQLRTMGAPRRYLALVVWLLIVTVAALGAVSGLLLGTAGAFGAAFALTNETGIAMSPALGIAEAKIVLTTLAAGGLFALLPAVAAGRAKLN